MTETANILNNATDRSLVILDEIGRGTSTLDGLSLAWAIAEHIARQCDCRTLFATHYHELTDLAERFSGVKNLNVAVREWEDQVIFLHRIVEGGTDRSYGIHVARLAGVPKPVLDRARQLLSELAVQHISDRRRPRKSASTIPTSSPSSPTPPKRLPKESPNSTSTASLLSKPGIAAGVEEECLTADERGSRGLPLLPGHEFIPPDTPPSPAGLPRGPRRDRS